jgi:hypothetical protein
MSKTKLDVTLVPNLVCCCAILHNMVLGVSDVHLEQFMHIVAFEAE